MTQKYFNVKNGVTTGDITLHAGNGNVTANYFLGSATLSNLSVTGNSSLIGPNVFLGSVANLKITGGTSDYVLTTDGTGNLSWAPIGGNTIGGGILAAYDSFVGDGSTTQYTLTVTPKNENQTFINIDGVFQLRDAYTLSGNIITFSSPPVSGCQIDVSSFLISDSVYSNTLLNGLTNIDIPAANSNITMSVNGTTNVAVISTSGINVSGNISSGYLLGNGYYLTGLPATYSNANVAGYLPTYTGAFTAANVTATGNISGSYILGNGSLLTGLPATYSNANVASYLPTYTGNITAGNITISSNANVTGNINVTGTIIPSAGSGTNDGIVFPYDPGGIGTNDSASIKYYAVSGEQTRLEIKVTDNGPGSLQDDLYLTAPSYTVVNNTNEASSTTDAPFQVLGGAGIAKKLYVGGNIEAGTNYIKGNGYYLTGLPATYSNANVAGYLPTYTGNITAGNISATGNVTGVYILGNGSALSSITGGNVTGQVGNALIAGTVYTNAQPNITSLGTLASLNVTGNISSGSYFVGNGYYLTGISSQSIIGAYSNANVANYLPTFTGNIQAGNASLGNLVSANYVQGTLTTGSQPNITSVGTITELNVSGNANVSTNFNLTGNAVIAGNLIVNGTTEYTNVNNLYIKDPIIEMGGGANADPLTTNDGKDRGSLLHYYTTSPVDAFMGWDNSNGEFGFGSNVSVSSEVVTWNNYGNIRAGYFLGNGSQLTGVAAVTATTAQTVTSNAQPNITSLGTLSSLNVTGNISSAANITASYFIGNGSSLSSITGGNVTGQVANALIAGTVYTNAQPNITSVGTLSSLSITGNVSSAANITASYFVGDGSALTSINAGSITGQVANALIAGTVYTNAQPNITSLGTLSSLNVTGNVSSAANVTASYFIGNGSALSSITGGNVTGQVANALVAGTVYTNAQPNITSLGTLNGLTSTSTVDFTSASNVSLGTVSNLHITGGLNGYYLKTDGTGNLSWSVAIASAAGNDTEIQFNDGGAVNASANLTFNKSSNVLTVGGNITTNNANLGNLATANYFTGNGVLLSSITGANVTGQVANALVASTVYTNAQPNITSLGTLANLSVTGNISTAANVTAGYYVGNGSALTSITGSSVTGQVSNAIIAGTVYTNAQPNITSLGALSSLTIVGNVTSGNANLGNLATSNFFSGNGRFLSGILGSNITGQVGNALIAGTVYNNNQPNITSVGTLTSLDVTSNISSGSWLTASIVESTNSGGIGENFKVGDDAWIGDINVDSSFQIKGQFDGTTGGIVFGNGDQSRLYRTGTGPLTYEGNVSANWFIGNGSRLSSLTGANVTGQVGNALIAGTVYSNAQPNITSIGRLTTLNVSGNITSGNLQVNANSIFSNISVSGTVGSNLIPTGNKIYSLGTPTNRWRDLWLASTTIYLGDLQLSATDNDLILSGNLSSGNANLGNLAVANYFSGTFDVLSGAQPNITSLGNLSSLVIVGNLDAGILNTVDVNATGNIIIGGNLTVSGNTQYTNVETLIVEDPVIEMGGGPNGDPLTTNDGKDRGSLLHYYTTAPVDAFMGWDNSNAEFAFGSNVSITNDVVTFNNFGNVRASLFIGNLQGNATTAGTVTIGAQPNITSLGTLASLNVTGNITSGNASLGNLASATYISGNGSLLSSITGANVTGQVANALVASTVYTNAQPNITSLGTLATLDVTANISSGNANLGNLATASYFTGDGSLLSGITGPNVTGQVANSLTAGTVYTNAQPNITSVGTLSSLNVTANVTASYFVGNGSALSSITGANVTGQVANALVASTVYTNAQPNITSLGTLASLSVTGNISTAANVTAGYYVGDGSALTNINAVTAQTIVNNAQPNITSVGTLSSLNVTGNVTASYFIGNVLAGNITGQVANALVAGTVYTNAQPNITSLGTLTSLNVSGNTTATNFIGTLANGNSNISIAANSDITVTPNGSAHLWRFSADGNLYVPESGQIRAASPFYGISVQDNSSNSYLAVDGATAYLQGNSLVRLKINGGTEFDFTNGLANLGAANLVTTGNITATNLIGSLVTQSQPNITSIGTLTSLNVTSNVTAGNIKTDHLLYANGVVWDFAANAAGSNTQVQFNDENSFAGSANFTFNKTTNTLSVTNIIGNGAGITYVTGSNVNGQVGNALIAGTVYSNSQPNITSVGTLTSVTVTGNVSSGNANLGNLVTANYFSGDGSLLTNLNIGSYSVNYAAYAGNVTLASQPNITSLGTLSSLNVSGNATAGNVTTSGIIHTTNATDSTGTGTGALIVDGGASVLKDLWVGGTIHAPNLDITTYNALTVDVPLLYLNANVPYPYSYDIGFFSDFTGGPANLDAHTGFVRNHADNAWYLFSNILTEPAGEVLDLSNANIIFDSLKVGSIDSFGNVIITGNITSGNANLGNVVIANYYSGNGSLLSSITGSNVTGQVGNALVAGTVYTNAQPNITSLGTLSTLSVAANISAGNANLGNLVSANYFTGDGGFLSNLQIANASVANANYALYAGYADNVNGANVNGQVANALIAGTVYTNAQPNITSLGTLSSLNVTANVTANYFVGNGNQLSDIAGSNVTGQVANALVAGTVYTNAQPNITSVGTLSSLNVTANVTAAQFIGNGILLSNIAGSNVSGQVGNALLAGTVYTNAQPNITSVGTLSNLDVSGNVTGSYFLGNGAALSSITGSNVTGTVANATYATSAGTAYSVDAGNISGQVANALIAGTVYTNAQPNITSVGTLSSLNVTANVTASHFVGNGATLSDITGSNVTGTVANATYAITAGTAYSVSGSNVSGQVGNALIAGTVYTNAQPNITSLGTLSSLNVTANVTADYFVGNGATLSSITGSNVTGQVANALVAGTVYTNAQPNITSLGTLTNLTVSGNANITTNLNVSGNAVITGNLVVQGNTQYTNVDTLVIEDPVIEMGGGPNGDPLTTNDGKDRGSLLHYYTTAPVDAFMGWDNSNAEFAFGSNVSITNDVVTFNDLGNIRANYFIGNGSLLTGVTATTATTATTAGTVTTNAQPNITSVGTLSTLNVSGNVTGSYFLGNGSALTSITGANVTGTVANATYATSAGSADSATTAGTVTTNAQPNITSVGTLSSLNVSGNVTGSHFVGNGATLSSITGANVTGTVANANYATYAGTAYSIDGANVTGQVGNALIAATVYENAQPNITSVGTLTSLDVTSNISVGNLLTDSILYANGTAYQFTTNAAGINTQIQFNNNNSFGATSAFTFNRTTSTLNIEGNITTHNANLGNLVIGNYIQGTLTTGNQPNITSTGTLSTLTVTGNVSANYYIGNGSTLSDITGSNVTGTVANATYATTSGTAYSVSGSNVVGDVSGANHANIADVANSVSGGNVSGQVANALIAGTVYTNAQPNITSVGTLTSLNITGNATASYFIGNGSQLTGVIGSANYATYAGTVLTNAQPNITSVGTLSSLNVTANVTADYFVGNGATLSSITGANVTGTVANATYSITSGTAYSVSGSNVVGDVSGANHANIADVANSVSGSNVTGQVANALVAGTVYTNAQPNITSVGTLTSLNVTGNVSSGANVTASHYIGNGSALSSITGGNVTGQVGNALIAGTVYTNAQPNITSVGTLTNLTVSGNANVTTNLNVSGDAVVTGNLTVQGNTQYTNVETLIIEDPVIEMGGGPNGAPLTTNDGKDRGSLLHYYSGAPIDAFMGWDNSNAEFGFGSNVTITNDVITWNNYGNLRANYFIGNGSLLTSLTGSNVVGDVSGANHANIADVANSVAGANVTGQVGNALVAGTVYTNAQPNITSVGTLTSLNVSGNTTASYFLGNGATLSSITGSNVTGQVGNALIAGTVYTNAQPNITSVGTLSSLNVTANVTASYFVGNGATLSSITGSNVTGTVANATYAITAGTAYSVNGANVSGDVSGANHANVADVANSVSGSNVSGQVGNALIAGTVYTNAQPNITSVGTLTSLNVSGNATASYFSGNGSLLTSLTGGNITGQVANALVSGTVYTNAQPNITSVGTLSSLNVTGNITSSANVTASYFLGNGSDLTSITGANVTGQVSNALIAGTVYTNAQPNITSLGTLTNLTVTANTTSGNLITGGIVSATGNVSGSYILGNGSALSSITGANVTGQVGNALIAGTVYTNAQPNITSVGTLASLSVSGLITATGTGIKLSNIQDSSGTVALSIAGGNLTVYNNIVAGSSGAGNVTASYFVGDGSALTSITGSSVTGQVANALIAGTVYTNAQPNITSVGTLTNLAISGNANITTDINVSGNAVITGNLVVSGTTEYTNVNNLYIKDPIIEMGGGVNAAPLTTNDGKDRGSLLHYYSGAPIDAFMGWDNSNAEFAFGSNVTVTNEVVTFNDLGNIRANYFIGNGSQLTGVIGSANYATYAGTVLTNAQPNITSVGTLASLNVTGNISSAANITASYFIGNGSELTNITGGNVTGQVGNSLVAGTVYTNAQPNITSLGTLASLTVTANTTSGNLITGGVVSATGNISGSYILGNGSALTGIATSTTAITVTGNDQPNITSTGTLSGLTVSGNASFTGANVSLGNVSNLHIFGGSTNYVLTTDGAGNLSWGAAGGGGGGIAYTAAATPPASGNVNGDQWLNTSANVLYEYMNDGTASYWVDIQTPSLAGAATTTYVNRTYTADGSSAAFTVSNGCNVLNVLVFLNGICQIPTTDYTISGATLTFDTAPAVSTLVMIRELPR